MVGPDIADCEMTAAAMNNARAAAQPTHTFQNPLTLIATSIQLIIAPAVERVAKFSIKAIVVKESSELI